MILLKTKLSESCNLLGSDPDIYVMAAYGRHVPSLFVHALNINRWPTPTDGSA